MQLPLLQRPKYNLGMEMIDFQENDTFGADLEKIYTEIQRKVIDGTFVKPKDVEKSKEVQDAIDLIFKRFNMRVAISTAHGFASVMSFYSNRNHIFLPKLLSSGYGMKEHDAVMKILNGKKGTVDIKNAKLGGIFSEYVNYLFLNFHEIFKTEKLSVPEAVAITLHELGHAFNACEYSDRLETNNQVLQSVAKEIMSSKKEKDLVYIYRELKTVNSNITEEEVDKLVNGNRVIAGYTWFKVVVGSVEEQLRNSKYSETTSERLADGFAARMGYGRQMMIGLDKLESKYNPMEKKDIGNFADAALVILYVVLGVFTLAFGTIPAVLVISAAFYMNLRMSGSDKMPGKYDELKARYQRLRNDYVERLKNMDLPLEVVKEVLEDVAVMDRCINETYRYSTFLTRVCDYIFASAKKAEASIAEQKLLEELAFNDLFIRSAELRTI